MGRTAKPLIAALLALLGASAHAGYAQAVPPAGFSELDRAASSGRWGYAKAANEAWTSATVRTTASLNVGGRTVTMPAAMRFASNAPRYAAGILFAHPLLRTGLAAAAWLGVAKIFWDEVDKVWKLEDKQIIDYFYYGTHAWGDDPRLHNHTTPGAVCSAFFALYQGYESVQIVESGPERCVARTLAWYGWLNQQADIYRVPRPCPTGSEQIEPGKCKMLGNGRPLTKEEFEKELAPEVWRPESPGKVPENFPDVVPPGTPLPVDPPVINPAPGPLPQTPAAPRPWFVPLGDPVPNPNYNPSAPTSPENQPYIRPGVNIRPSPTLAEPWRVDLQPVDRPQLNPEPVPDDQLNPEPNPDNSDNPPNDKPKPEESQSLCEKHPDIAACAKLDDVEPEDVQNQQEQLSITPSTGWESGASTCPAPVTRQVAGLTLEMQWQPFCDLATGIRPVILALAWVAAAMMVIGVARRGE